MAKKDINHQSEDISYEQNNNKDEPGDGTSETVIAEEDSSTSEVNQNEEETEETVEDEERIKCLKEELEVLRREKRETIELLQRIQADFDNFRKRTAAEKEEIRAYSLFDFIGKIIPVLDNLDRALDSAKNKEVPHTYIEGLDMIRKQISQLLEQQGVSPIEAKGCIFDPHFHEAVLQSEEGEGEPNTVVEELQRGYVMKGRILRPAMVKVCK